MALKSSGKLTLGGAVATEAVAAELNKNPTALITLNDADVRTLAGIPSGRIRFPLDFYGKSFATILPPISSNSTALTITPADVSGYVAGQARVQLNIDSGAYLYCTSGSGALIISGFTAGDQISIVNNGYIIGCGGDGGKYYDGGLPTVNNPGGNGGPAITTSCDLIIQNNGYIAGGGGGGRSGNGGVSEGYTAGGGGGGGAGGGRGGSFNGYALGGLPGQPGQNGFGGVGVYQPIGGAGGGRIFPGTGGAGTQVEGDFNFTWTSLAQGGGAGGGGGGYMGYIDSQEDYGDGAPGGSANNAGANAPYYTSGGGGGGGWGASGGSGGTGSLSRPAQPGGLGGKAIALNGRSATVSGSGTIYGAIS